MPFPKTKYERIHDQLAMRLAMNCPYVADGLYHADGMSALR